MKNVSLFDKNHIQGKPSNYQFSGRWIGPATDVHPGQWLSFRKSFKLSLVPSQAVVRLTVESKYWLWVNGQLVVFEGQVKNGPAPQSAYFDKLDISQYLIPGENVIALLTVYFGKNGYGFFDSGTPGLIFDADFGAEGQLLSDEQWVAIPNPAYHESAPQSDRSYRLAEPDINYFATDSLGDWQALDYDDQNWEHVVTKPMPFKALWERPIPELKIGHINRYSASGSSEQAWSLSDQPHADKTNLYAIKNRTNLQGTAYLKVIAPADQKIEIYTDTWKEAAGHGNSVRHVYHTKAGVQEFEALGWFNGHRIFFEIPKAVKVLTLGFRPSGYALETPAEFESDSRFMNKLNQKSFDTLYVTMRDSFMDCPDRERAQWIGDAVIEMEMAFYGMDENAGLLFKKAMNQALNFQHSSGAIPTTAPNGIDSSNLDAEGNLKKEIIESGRGGGNFELPMQSLAFVTSFWKYYRYSGDRQPLEDGFPKLMKYLRLWKFDDTTGLVSHRGGTWDWPDWGSHPDARLIEQCWYYAAAKAVVNIGNTLNHVPLDDINFLQHRLDGISEHFEANFWRDDKKAYYDETDDSQPDDRANALVVYAGLANDQHRLDLIHLLKTRFNASPYMEKIVLEALYLLNADQEALQRTYKRYQQMVNDDFPTLWEFWQANKGTRNHAWTGGPLIMMYRYNLGLQPLSAGYQKLLVRPHIAAFNHLKAEIHTSTGPIAFEIKRELTQTTMQLTASKQVEEVELDIPKALLKDRVTIDGQLVYREGDLQSGLTGVKSLGEDTFYLKFKVTHSAETHLVVID